jgi:hypothetical protein
LKELNFKFEKEFPLCAKVPGKIFLRSLQTNPRSTIPLGH